MGIIYLFFYNLEWVEEWTSDVRIAKSDNRNCDTLNGYHDVTDMEVCKAIARNTNRKFKGPETDLSYPKGCYALGDEKKVIYFNFHDSGAGRWNGFPICVKSMYILVSRLRENLSIFHYNLFLNNLQPNF